MRRLRSTDGTAVHRRSARYHMSRCTSGGAPLHATLAGEMNAKYTALVAKARATEDAADGETAASALLDAAEVQIENVIRDLDGELARLDRTNPALGAQAITFPAGFGAIIEPDGDAQIKVLGPLRNRVAPFKDEPGVAATLQKLADAEAALEAALDGVDTAETASHNAFAEETIARAAVRAQLESAYGRLRDLYQARPALTEGFFLKDAGSRRRPATEPAPTNEPLDTAPAASPSPAAPSPA